MTPKDYQEAVEWLFVQMPNYQIDGQKAYKPGLDNIRKLCDFFGNPQDKIKTVHIGGTNGKGSTSNMLASVLQESGYRVGLYNSPHLISQSESKSMEKIVKRNLFTISSKNSSIYRKIFALLFLNLRQ